MQPTASTPALPALLIFGSQIQSLDATSASALRALLARTPALSWTIDAAAELPSLWAQAVSAIPELESSSTKELLDNFSSWLRTGILPEALPFPLPNAVLTPLVVIYHLAQYAQYLDAAALVQPTAVNSTTTLGLCTGLLSAAVASSATNQQQLATLSRVAIRLAALVGAVVDADNASSEAVSTSVGWSAAEPELREKLDAVLAKFADEAYVSVLQDQNRVTVTAAKEVAGKLREELKAVKLGVTEIGLVGRFHSAGHKDVLEKLSKFVEGTPALQFGSEGGRSEGILKAMLVEQPDWASEFRALGESTTADGQSLVFGFGPENVAPPALVRSLGARFHHLTTLDLSGAGIPATLLGFGGPAEYRAKLFETGIAVVGMAAQMPGASDLDEFWDIMRAGKSQHQEVPRERFEFDANTVFRPAENRKWYGNFVRDYNTFDHKFFKKSPREMASTDPQHRLMLQIAYQAVEQSGHFNRPQDERDDHIGVYIGVGLVDYERNIACSPANAYSATGNLKAFAAGKISHTFGWTGPGLTIDTACSSSSVAVHTACRAILSGECTGGALAGGVNIMTSPEWFQNLAGASFLSPTGQCKSFDARGDGYCRAEGVGAVFLKKLSTAVADGDRILGVIAGSAVWQNQNCTPITVPNSPSLSGLFRNAIDRAGLEPKHITYVEAHGTGTPVGDPAEVAGVRSVLGGSSCARSNGVSLGSVKGLIGHTESASGIASLLKVLVMMDRQQVPPQASFESLNPAIEITPEDKMDISTAVRPWDVDLRAALINNYGASGSNACLVVTQGPKRVADAAPLPTAETSAVKYPFWFAGHDESALRRYIARFRKWLATQPGPAPSVASLSFELSRQSNRTLPSSLLLTSASLSDLDSKLAQFEAGATPKDVAVAAVKAARPVVLCFGGQVSNFVGLDKSVYESVGVFRGHIDAVDAALRAAGLGSIFPAVFQTTPIESIVALQTALFAVQYSSAKSWLSSGVRPVAVVGFSFGELTALAVSGVLSLEDAVKLIAGRAALIEKKWGSDSGAMIAVEGDKALVDKLLAEVATQAPGAAIACYSGPTSFTLAGPKETMEFIPQTIAAHPEFAAIRQKKLDVTHAFHSVLVDSLYADVEKLGEGLTFNKPTIPVERATESATSTDHLTSSFAAAHLRNPVCFSHAVDRLVAKHGDAIWLEAGFNSTITSIAGRTAKAKGTHHFQPINLASENAVQQLADATLTLWKEGVNVSFWPHHRSQRADYDARLLPPYQFDKAVHWMALLPPPKQTITVAAPAAAAVAASIPEKPRGFWSFEGFQDPATQSLARFRVHTTSDEFDAHVRGHIIARAAPLCPSPLQLNIAVAALRSLPSNAGLQPRSRDMVSHAPLSLDPARAVFLEAAAQDAGKRVWNWKIVSEPAATPGTGKVTHVVGTISFAAANEQAALLNEFAHYERIVRHEHCQELLTDGDADEVVKGPSKIYRRFTDIVEYGSMYKCVVKLVAKGSASAGRVIRKGPAVEDKHNGGVGSWPDIGAGDSFCQVAGIFVNTMTDVPDTDIYISDRIDQWIPLPDTSATDKSVSEDASAWDVLALHRHPTDKKYISDVFVFEASTGRLAEIILGIHYQRVGKAGLSKALSRFAAPGTVAAVVPKAVAPVQVAPAVNDFYTVPNGTNGTNGFHAPAPAVAAPTPAPAPAVKKAGPSKAKSQVTEINNRIIDILVNLVGLDADELQPESDLVEMGIDSLMGMELAREIEITFKISLSNDDLMELTTIHSLNVLVQKTLGVDGSAAEEEEEVVEAPVTNGHSNGVNGVNGHATNGANGHATNGNGATSGPFRVPAETVLTAFAECKAATDDFIREHNMGGYVDTVLPRSDELCAVHLINAFEQLGCPIRSAKAGDELPKIEYLPRHQRFVDWIYEFLEKNARILDVDANGRITRTAIALPSKPADALYQDLVRANPEHRYDHDLTQHIGPEIADCLVGKQEGVQLMFGRPEGREIASNMYGKSPINVVWIKQMESFLRGFVGRLNIAPGGEPLRILEMGAGTGGTTAKILPLLASLGVPVRYTVTDLSSSLVATARKRFKGQFDFVDYKVVDIEGNLPAELLESQHMVLATNCVHATHNLVKSTGNIRRLLRPDGMLLMLEMTTQVPWVDLTFGPVEGWWLFDDGRKHALAPPEVWDDALHAAGYGHVDWTDGHLPEAAIQRVIIALASAPSQ
ncbi:polyketide synthase, partial [Chaetomium sp. MPI-SDFR-AT-0129]